jgi:hypothetical protein
MAKKYFVVRVEEEIYNKLKENASKESRSVTNYVNAVLRNVLQA